MFAMRDVAAFLKRHPPFDDLDAATVVRLAERADVERFRAGTKIFEQGANAPDAVRVVREGAASSSTTDGSWIFSARVSCSAIRRWSRHFRRGSRRGHTVTRRAFSLPAEEVLPLLARPAGLRYLARSLLDRPRPGSLLAAEVSGCDLAQQPVTSLVSKRPIICEPETPLREAATQMAEAGASSCSCASGRDGSASSRIATCARGWSRTDFPPMRQSAR